MLRRPSQLAPLITETASQQSSPLLDSPDPALNGDLSDSGRFNFGQLVITSQGVAATPTAGGARYTDATTSTNGEAPLDFKELQGLEIIGRGASGFVRRAEHLPSGRVMAIKEICVSDDARRKQIFKEISTLLSTGESPHLVYYHGARSYDGAIQIAMEYMDGGSLGDLLQAIGPVSEECIGAIAEQALLALADLRDRHLVHRDLKPQNILLNLRGQCKVSDFGCVAELQDSFGKCGTFVGTVPYMSPERINGDEYSYASDVWSFGLTIVECALGHFPYARCNGYWGILQAVLKEPSPSLAGGDRSAELVSFVDACLRKDPNERPSARKLLAHPFILKHGSSAAAAAAAAASASSGDSSASFSLKRFLCQTFAVTPEPSPQARPAGTGRWGAHSAAGKYLAEAAAEAALHGASSGEGEGDDALGGGGADDEAEEGAGTATAVEVVVPEGASPGSDFEVEWGGVAYDIAVPEGVRPGETLTVRLPGSGDAETQQTAEEAAVQREAARDEEVHSVRQELQAAQYANRQLRRELDSSQQRLVQLQTRLEEAAAATAAAAAPPAAAPPAAPPPILSRGGSGVGSSCGSGALLSSGAEADGVAALDPKMLNHLHPADLERLGATAERNLHEIRAALKRRGATGRRPPNGTANNGGGGGGGSAATGAAARAATRERRTSQELSSASARSNGPSSGVTEPPPAFAIDGRAIRGAPPSQAASRPASRPAGTNLPFVPPPFPSGLRRPSSNA